MKSIPVVRASYVSPIVNLLMERGVPVEALLKEAGLPSIVLEPQDEFVAALGAWRLLELAQSRWGVMDAGAESARRLDRSMLWPVVSVMSRAHTVHRALQGFCRAVMEESSHARFWVVRDGQDSWLCRCPSLFDVGKAQAEAYVIVYCVRLLRELLGKCWRPARIKLAAAGKAEVEQIKEVEDVEVEFGAPFTAIAVSDSLELRAHDIGLSSYCAGEHAVERPSAPTAPLQALRSLLRPHLHDAYPSIKFAAEAMGTSARTLQRRLAQEGFSYSELIDRARFDLAVDLLTGGHVKITDIAYELGFKDPGSFSRTFRRLSGFSPSEYRRASHEQPSTLLGWGSC